MDLRIEKIHPYVTLDSKIAYTAFPYLFHKNNIHAVSSEVRDYNPLYNNVLAYEFRQSVNAPENITNDNKLNFWA